MDIGKPQVPLTFEQYNKLFRRNNTDSQQSLFPSLWNELSTVPIKGRKQILSTNAAVTVEISLLFRSGSIPSVTSLLITNKEKEEIKAAFDQLNSHEKANCVLPCDGASTLYKLPEYPDRIIKEKASSRYLDIVKSLRPLINRYENLHLPEMVALDDEHLLEEKLPVPGSIFELVMGYLDNKEGFTKAVRKITETFCRGAVIEDLRNGSLYTHYDISRYDNLPPLIYTRNKSDEKIFKIGLIDLDHLSIIKNPDFTDVVGGIEDLVYLYPIHIEEIVNVIKERFTVSAENEQKLRDIASFQASILDRNFTKYKDYLDNKEELKPITLSLQHLQEIRNMGADNEIVMMRILKTVNKEINAALKYQKETERKYPAIEERTVWLNNILYKFVNKKCGGRTSQLREASDYARKLLVGNINYLHEKGYIYLNHDITVDTDSQFDQFMF